MVSILLVLHTVFVALFFRPRPSYDCFPLSNPVITSLPLGIVTDFVEGAGPIIVTKDDLSEQIANNFRAWERGVAMITNDVISENMVNVAVPFYNDQNEPRGECHHLLSKLCLNNFTGLFCSGQDNEALCEKQWESMCNTFNSALAGGPNHFPQTGKVQ